jgi:uncharacterized protein with PhoU and TrkA domain
MNYGHHQSSYDDGAALRDWDDDNEAERFRDVVDADMQNMSDMDLADEISDLVNAGAELPDEVHAVWSDSAASIRDLARLVRRDYPDLLRDIAERRCSDDLGW